MLISVIFISNARVRSHVFMPIVVEIQLHIFLMLDCIAK